MAHCGLVVVVCGLEAESTGIVDGTEYEMLGQLQRCLQPERIERGEGDVHMPRHVAWADRAGWDDALDTEAEDVDEEVADAVPPPGCASRHNDLG